MAAKKAAPRKRSHPVTKTELIENNPNIADAVTTRLSSIKNLAITITAIAGAIYVAIQVYSWAGGRWMVSDWTLDHAITAVKTEVNTKIDATKNEVVSNQNSIKGEINTNLNELTKTLNSVAKNQNISAIDAAEMASKLAFTQLQSVQGQLATWKQQVAKDPNDQQAQMRVLQLETFVKQNEQDMQEAKQKMSRLRSGQ